MNKIQEKQNLKEIKKVYKSPILKEIGRIKHRTKGSSIDETPDSGSFSNAETHIS